MTVFHSYNFQEENQNTNDQEKSSWDPFGQQQGKNPNNGNNKKKPKPKFNFYWIYGILILMLIVMQYFSFSGEVKEVDWNTVEDLIEKHDIQKIVVINNKFAEIYIKKDKLVSGDTLFKDVKTKGLGNGINPGPHFLYKFLTVDGFREDLKESQDKTFSKDTTGKTPVQIQQLRNEEKIIVTADDRRNWTGDVLSYILPIIILVGAWFLIMRMMNRGGGGAGQIFNFGKSKAQLFDKNTHSASFKMCRLEKLRLK